MYLFLSCITLWLLFLLLVLPLYTLGINQVSGSCLAGCFLTAFNFR